MGPGLMLTTVSIGPERTPVLRENTTGPASTPQTLRVCSGPGTVLGTWEPGPEPGWESSHSYDSRDGGGGVGVKG